jgi:hypothetical protein
MNAVRVLKKANFLVLRELFYQLKAKRKVLNTRRLSLGPNGSISYRFIDSVSKNLLKLLITAVFA